MTEKRGRRKNLRAPKMPPSELSGLPKEVPPIRPAQKPLDYAASGVDIDAADDAKKRIRKLVESTFTSGAVGKFGGFGGNWYCRANFVSDRG